MHGITGKPLDVFGDTSDVCGRLAKRDAGLRNALEAIGEPYIRKRPGGFEALFRIITEQQVSVASAGAVWARCCDGLGALTPRTAVDAGEDALRSFGLTRPKARYVLHLAQAFESGQLSENALRVSSDPDARAALMNVKGIGPWTAAIYLLFCEGRVDIWPPGDVALLSAYRRSHARNGAISLADFDRRSDRWAPYRGVAAHILWTFHAHVRGKTPI